MSRDLAVSKIGNKVGDERRRALFVGVSRYDHHDIPDLRTPRNDIDAVRRLVCNGRPGAYRADDLCMNETVLTVKRRLETFFDGAGEEDVLLLFFAGHGLRDDEGQVYFAASDTDPTSVAASAIEREFLLRLFRRSAARHIFVLLDCCYSGQLGKSFRSERDIEVRINDQFQPKDRGISILSASGYLQVAYENEDFSVFTEALLAAAADGGALRDTNDRIDIVDLSRYMQSRLRELGERQMSRLVHDDGGDTPYFCQAPRRERPVSEFDAERYVREVLDPAVAQGRPTADIVRRYQLSGDFDGEFELDEQEIIAEVDRVVKFWKHHGSVNHRRIVRALQLDHRAVYAEMFTSLHNGDPLPLRHAIELGRRNPDLVGRIAAKAHPLKIIATREVVELRSEGVSDEDITQALRTAGVTVAGDWHLPPEPTAPGASRLAADLAELELRHVGELLYPADRQGRRVHVKLTRTDAAEPLDGTGPGSAAPDVAAAEASAAARWNGDRLDAAHRVLSLVDALTPAELQDLITRQLADRLFDLRDSGGGVKQMLGEARLLGVIEPGDRELAYVVQRAVRSHTDERAEDVTELVRQGRVAAAAGMLNGQPSTMPGHLEKQIRTWMARATAWHEEAARDPHRPDARRLLRRARALVADLPVTVKIEPPPPTDVRCTYAEGQTTVEWSAHDTDGADVATARFTVRRYTASHPRGVVVAQTTASPWVDTRPPNNESTSYTVVVEVDGTPSTESERSETVLLRPEVAGLRVDGRDGAVDLRWVAPDGAVAVQVRRRVDGEPSRSDPVYYESPPGSSAGGGWTDEAVQRGHRYLYLISVVWEAADSTQRRHVTPGLLRAAKPGRAPVPVKVLGFTQLTGPPPVLAVDVSPAPEGHARVIQTVGEPPPAGTVLQTDLLMRHGRLLPSATGSTTGRILLEAPAVDSAFALVTVNDDRAAVGASFRWTPLEPVEPVSQRRLGDMLRLSWPRPQSGQAVRVRWRIADRDWQERITMSHTVDLPVTGAAVSVEVQPIGRVGPHRLIGPPTQLTVAPRPIVEYDLTRERPGLLRGGNGLLVLTVTAREDVRLSRLVVVAGQRRTQPLDPSECPVLLTLTDIPLRAGLSKQFRIDPSTCGSARWIACFTDDEVDLRHPPVPSRRIGATDRENREGPFPRGHSVRRSWWRGWRRRLVVCPFCCHEFGRSKLLFKCAVGTAADRPCPTAVEMPANGRAPICSNCGHTAYSMLCPGCRSELPTGYADSDCHFIALVGPTASGKSTFISMFARAVKHEVGGGRLNVTIVPANDDTNERCQRRIELLAQGRVVGGTQSARHGAADARPLIFLLTRPDTSMFGRRRNRVTSLVFVDTAGEDVGNEKLEARYLGEYLKRATGMVFFIDPLQLPGAVADLAETSWLTQRPIEAARALANTTNVIRQGRGLPPNARLRLPVAAVLSKIDEIDGTRLSHSPLYLQPDPIGGLDHADRESVHEYVRALLHQWEANDITGLLDDRYRTFSYFGVSALGARASHDVVADDGIGPLRIVDPLLWMLDGFRLLPRTGGRR